MKFYKSLVNKKYNPIGFIVGFILTIAIAWMLTGCGHDTNDADGTIGAAAEAASVEDTAGPKEQPYLWKPPALRGTRNPVKAILRTLKSLWIHPYPGRVWKQPALARI